MATLHLICGMAGAGKTTLAKRLERERGAVRLSPDEWITRLMSAPNDRVENEQLRDPVEALQWELAQRLLTQGVDVILENGFWGKDERARYRDRGRELGVKVVLHFLDVPEGELWRRLEARNRERQDASFKVSLEELKKWMSWFQKPDARELATYDQDDV